MDAEATQVRTGAEQALLAQFGARARADEPDWLSRRRAADFARISAAGLPNRRLEAWRYTDLRRLMGVAHEPATRAAADAVAAPAGEPAAIAALGGARIVFVNGFLRADLSDLDRLPAGVELVSFAQAARRADGILAARLGKAIGEGDEVIAALNGAFAEDGAVIRVADGADIAEPVRLVCLTRADAPLASHLRTLVVAGPKSRLRLVESHAGEGDYQATSVSEFFLGEGAVIDHVRIQNESRAALHLGLLAARLDANAALRSFALSLGGAVARQQTHIVFDGAGGQANASGALLLHRDQHADASLFVDHAVPACTSREVYKSVLDGAARGVFQGRILVRPHAQKTDGRMSSRALMLSDKAEMDARPELEIFADDVQCAHGATTGQIDEDMLFYLRARGIPPETARGLLVQAFVGEAVEEIADGQLRDAVMGVCRDWLGVSGEAA